MALIQQEIKKLPGTCLVRRFAPYIGCILSAVHVVSESRQTILDARCRLFVVCQIVLQTFLAFGRKSSHRRPLGDIRSAVIFGTLAAQPHGIETDLLRHNGISAAHGSESRAFTETAHLNSNLLGSLQLIDTMRHIGFGDIRLVSGIEDDDTMVGYRIIDPPL